jgi:hypothetical protein
MKNLKQITKTACIAFIMLCSFKPMSAHINVSYLGGTYNVCAGEAIGIYVNNCPSGWFVPNGSAYWTSWTGSYSIQSYSTDGVAFTVNSGTVTVVEQVYDPYDATFYPATLTFNCYTTSVSGTTDFCSTSNETYTASSTEGGLLSAYAWSVTTGTNSVPSFLSGSSTTSTINTTTTGTGTGTITVTANGCPSGSASNVGTLSVTSYPNPGTPGGTLTFTREASSCYYYATIPAVTSAEEYKWSINGGSTFFATTAVPNDGTTDQEFQCNYSYNIYVEVDNPCGSTNYQWNSQSPGSCPGGCTYVIKEGNLSNKLGDEAINEYKVYPNPASSEMTVEYTNPSDNSALCLSLYDILGHKLVNWNLPASESRVTENTSALPAGIYFYVINSGDNILTRGKLMIQK